MFTVYFKQQSTLILSANQRFLPQWPSPCLFLLIPSTNSTQLPTLPYRLTKVSHSPQLALYYDVFSRSIYSQLARQIQP